MLPPPNPATPDCPRATSALLERLDGSLGAADSLWLERHLARCPACRRLQAGLAADARRLAIESAAALPEAHVTAILAAIDRSASGVRARGSPAAQGPNRRDTQRPPRASAQARPQQIQIPELHAARRSPVWLASAAALLLVGLAGVGVWRLQEPTRPERLAAQDRPSAPAPVAQAPSTPRWLLEGSAEHGALQTGTELQGANAELLATAARDEGPRDEGPRADANPSTALSIPSEPGPLELAAAAPLQSLGDGSSLGDSLASDSASVSASDSDRVVHPAEALAPGLAWAELAPDSAGSLELAPPAGELALSSPDEALETPLEVRWPQDSAAALPAESEALATLAALPEDRTVAGGRVADESLAVALAEVPAAAGESELTARAALEPAAIDTGALAPAADATLELASAEPSGGVRAGDIPSARPGQRTDPDRDLAQALPSVSDDADAGRPFAATTAIASPSPLAVARRPRGAPVGRPTVAISSRLAPVSLVREGAGWRLSTQGDARQVVPALLDLLADRDAEIRELAQARLLTLAEGYGDWPLGQVASEDWWNSLDSTRARERRGLAPDALPDEAAWRRWWELRSSLLGAATH